MNRIKSLIEYVTLFRANKLVLKKRKQCKTKNENLHEAAENHENEYENLNTVVDYNRNCNNENIDEYEYENNDANENEHENENEIENENENEIENESNSLDQNSVVRIFSWNGNKDLNVSLLPDLPLFPYKKSEQDTNGMCACTNIFEM
jgi:hypothetical protein